MIVDCFWLVLLIISLIRYGFAYIASVKKCLCTAIVLLHKRCSFCDKIIKTRTNISN